jgi:putative flippase GtrA
MILDKYLKQFEKKFILLKKESFRYFIGGLVNSLFAYFFTITIFFLFKNKIGIIIIGIISSIICIFFSTTILKFFVFKSKNKWHFEYLKSYFLYGLTSLISIVMLYYFVDILNISIFFSQFFVIVITAIFNYFFQKYFIFKNNL